MDRQMARVTMRDILMTRIQVLKNKTRQTRVMSDIISISSHIRSEASCNCWLTSLRLCDCVLHAGCDWEVR